MASIFFLNFPWECFPDSRIFVFLRLHIYIQIYRYRRIGCTFSHPLNVFVILEYSCKRRLKEQSLTRNEEKKKERGVCVKNLPSKVWLVSYQQIILRRALQRAWGQCRREISFGRLCVWLESSKCMWNSTIEFVFNPCGRKCSREGNIITIHKGHLFFRESIIVKQRVRRSGSGQI